MLKFESLYERLKYDRIIAMRGSALSKLPREAITAVLASVDTQRGRGTEITDSSVMDIIKKEVRIFRECQSSDKQYLEDCRLKADFLENTYVPKQLSKEELLKHYSDTSCSKSPKEFMEYLDSLNLAGRYDKGIAAGIALGRVK